MKNFVIVPASEGPREFKITWRLRAGYGSSGRIYDLEEVVPRSPLATARMTGGPVIDRNSDEPAKPSPISAELKVRIHPAPAVSPCKPVKRPGRPTGDCAADGGGRALKSRTANGRRRMRIGAPPSQSDHPRSRRRSCGRPR